MCRECMHISHANVAMSHDKLSIEITYDIVIKNFLGETKKILYRGYNWQKTKDFFAGLNSGAISIKDYINDNELIEKQKYTVEVIVNSELFEFH